MARPVMAPHERRTERCNLRFTAAEMVHVQIQADASGLTTSEYLRRRALGYQVPASPLRRGSDPALVSELNRIGVNVNQLARAVHMDRSFVAYWKEIGRELTRTLEKIARAHDP